MALLPFLNWDIADDGEGANTTQVKSVGKARKLGIRSKMLPIPQTDIPLRSFIQIPIQHGKVKAEFKVSSSPPAPFPLGDRGQKTHAWVWVCAFYPPFNPYFSNDSLSKVAVVRQCCCEVQSEGEEWNGEITSATLFTQFFWGR